MGKSKSTSRKAAKSRTSGAPGSGTRLSVMKTYKVYINGKFPRTESGRYYVPEARDGSGLANVCRCSKKDFREAVVAARGAASKWAGAGAFLRGQILYRIAEMLEGRRQQFVTELQLQGSTVRQAGVEVDATIDRLVYYAGWSDKYQQVFSTVNPVSSSHFNFSVCEPMGVVSVIAPEKSGLLGLVSNIAPAIVGGNAVVVLASELAPLTAVTLGEALHSSDVPGGVVNILTGLRSELVEHFASHMDINAIVYSGDCSETIKTIQELAAGNVKSAILREDRGWESADRQSPYAILDTQEIKTTWHPIGS